MSRSRDSLIVAVICFGLHTGAAISAEKPHGPIGRPATTVQLPTFGVSVDADGVLALKSFPDPDGLQRAKRAALAFAALPPDVHAKSTLRKISLVQLEAAILQRLRAAKPIDDVMQNLAGLQRLQFVFFYPETGDVVIAGPAEGFVPDGSGRIVGITTGRPVLQLDQLAVALRAYPPGTNHKPFVGVTIGARQEGLARFREFRRTIPKFVPQHGREHITVKVALGAKRSLGMARVGVFTIPANSRFAVDLLEADYRMKLIGMGLEPAPVRMATFIELLKRPPRSVLQRWWFTPYYDCLRVANDKTAIELIGQGVQLNTEDQLIGLDGSLMNADRKPSKASTLYAAAFTGKYAEIAARVPVYAQMRNLIDMLVAAAFIRQEDFYGRSGWTAATFLDESAVPVQSLNTPKRVEAVVNAIWRGNRLIAPAGGVSIQADLALDEELWLRDQNGMLDGKYNNSASIIPHDGWWWD